MTENFLIEPEKEKYIVDRSSKNSGNNRTLTTYSNGTAAPRGAGFSFLAWVLFSMMFHGCDVVYHYVVYPPHYIEYTLVPDMDMLKATQDSSFKISRDSTTLIYDKKEWKLEIKYMTDFQLNTYDFPELSAAKQLSGNPYTFGNWVDPKLGYTPSRFANFRLNMYNYSSSKINLNPEQSRVETDRGDIVYPYGIARLKARYKSFEDYFQKLKGAGGSDEDLYETRMGVLRRTAFILSRPLFSGDSRDGIVTYDPLDPAVDRVKITYENVILGYDENNEPSRFTTISFYFKRVPMVKPTTAPEILALQAIKAAKKDSVSGNAALRDLIKGSLKITLLQFNFLPSAKIDPRETKYWNPLPSAIPALLDNLSMEGNIKAGMISSKADRNVLADTHVMMLIFGIEQPVFSDLMIQDIAEAIKNKTFLFVDDGYDRKDREYPYENFMRDFLERVGKAVDPAARLENVPESHSLYGNLLIPNQSIPKNPSATLVGLFVKGELVAVGARNSLYEQWPEAATSSAEIREEALRLGRNILIYGGSKKFSSQNGVGR